MRRVKLEACLISLEPFWLYYYVGCKYGQDVKTLENEVKIMENI
jgi:hypothetical protein